MLPNQNLNLMKLYASIHGVCGLAEGYSDTTVQFFKTLEQAKEHKGRLLDFLMKTEHEEVITRPYRRYTRTSCLMNDLRVNRRYSR